MRHQILHGNGRDGPALGQKGQLSGKFLTAVGGIGLAIERTLAAVRLHKPPQETDQRGFAAAIGTKHRIKLPGDKAGGKILKHRMATVGKA